MTKLLRALQTTTAFTFLAAAGLLLALSLGFRGWKALSVQTGSMEPAVKTGALVIVHSTSPTQLKAGDVVTYKSLERKGQTITHRLVGTNQPSDGPKQYILKGDANPGPDKAVYGDQIVGKVTMDVPFVGKVFDFAKTKLGLALLIYLPAALVAFAEIRLLIRRLSKIEVEKERRRLTDALRPAQAQPVAAGAAPAVPVQPAAPAPVASAPKTSQSATKKHSRPKLGAMGAVAAFMVLASGIGATFSVPNSSATLTSNSISAAEPPVEGGNVLIRRVDFPGALRDKVSFQPIVYLYNPVRGKTVDMEGWRLESSSGQVFGFRGKTPKDGTVDSGKG